MHLKQIDTHLICLSTLWFFIQTENHLAETSRSIFCGKIVKFLFDAANDGHFLFPGKFITCLFFSGWSKDLWLSAYVAWSADHAGFIKCNKNTVVSRKNNLFVVTLEYFLWWRILFSNITYFYCLLDGCIGDENAECSYISITAEVCHQLLYSTRLCDNLLICFVKLKCITRIERQMYRIYINIRLAMHAAFYCATE